MFTSARVSRQIGQWMLDSEPSVLSLTLVVPACFGLSFLCLSSRRRFGADELADEISGLGETVLGTTIIDDCSSLVDSFL